MGTATGQWEHRTPEYKWRGQMEISENLAYMFRQNFKNFTQNVDYSTHWPKMSILFRLLIKPQKSQFLFGLAHQTSKIPNLFRLASKTARSLPV
jgi:hypothetical protein